MARVEYMFSVYEDLRRIIDHLEQHEAEHVEKLPGEPVSASDVLTDNPLIGRPTHDDLRELVVGRGPRGYIAAVSVCGLAGYGVYPGDPRATRGRLRTR
jgi:plasmid stabilization system protein ParE